MDKECEFCDEDAVTQCRRCDALLCAQCRVRAKGKSYCPHCSELLDIMAEGEA